MSVRVLLIDDDDDDALITEELLQEAQKETYELVWVDNFEAGLAHITHNRCWDICLVDYRLGGEHQTGLVLLKKALAAGVDVPTIFLTGIEDPDIDREASQHGASDYLVKSQLTPQLLERSIRYAIANHKALRQIKEHERQKTLYAAAITHDLRTPIRGEFRILEQLKQGNMGPLNTLQQNIIEELIRSNQFLDRMVDNMITSYRIPQIMNQLNLESIDLGNFLKECTDSFKGIFKEKQQTLSFYCQEQMYHPFLDVLEFRRVIQNLLQNASQYTPIGGQISISTVMDSQNILITISNTGPGIDEQLIKVIFEPFQSMAKSKYKEVGTGLGLYVAHQIVTAHGGTIRVESTPGNGTCFYIELPCKR